MDDEIRWCLMGADWFTESARRSIWICQTDGVFGAIAIIYLTLVIE